MSTHSQLVQRMKVISAEIDQLAALPELTRQQETRWHDLTAEFERCDRARQGKETLADVMRSGGAHVERGTPVNSEDGYARDPYLGGTGPDVHVRKIGDPWAERIATFGRSPGEVASEARSIALAAVERVPDVPDHARDRFTRYLDTERGEPMGKVARWIRATSDPNYRSAWCKLAVDPAKWS